MPAPLLPRRLLGFRSSQVYVLIDHHRPQTTYAAITPNTAVSTAAAAGPLTMLMTVAPIMMMTRPAAPSGVRPGQNASKPWEGSTSQSLPGFRTRR